MKARLRRRSCLVAVFQPCTLEAGQETALTVTIPANSVSGDFSKAVFLETDAPGQEFLKLAVSGTAVPAVEVQPKREVYLGRLQPSWSIRWRKVSCEGRRPTTASTNTGSPA